MESVAENGVDIDVVLCGQQCGDLVRAPSPVHLAEDERRRLRHGERISTEANCECPEDSAHADLTSGMQDGVGSHRFSQDGTSVVS